MSDFYADLRRELLAAAERETRPVLWRFPRRAVRPIAIVAVSLAAIAALAAVAATVGQEAEREAVPGAPQNDDPMHRGGCADNKVHEVDGDVPVDTLSKFGLFRTPVHPEDSPPGSFPKGGPQIVRMHEIRSAGRHDNADAFVVSAEIISQAAMQQGPHCENAAAPPGSEGACLMLFEYGQWKQACWMLDQICVPNRTRPWMVRNGIGGPTGERARVAGIVPDAVRSVRFVMPNGRVVGEIGVHDNVYAGELEIGPHEQEKAELVFRF